MQCDPLSEIQNLNKNNKAINRAMKNTISSKAHLD